MNTGGVGAYSVGVEIKRTLAEGDKTVHHQSAKEVQYLAFESAQVFEKTNIVLTQFDEGEYRLQFQDPLNSTFSFSEPIKVGATTKEFKDAVFNFYRYSFNTMCDIDVELNYYDANDKVINMTLNAILIEE
jgi:hypothetical protein